MDSTKKPCRLLEPIYPLLSDPLGKKLYKQILECSDVCDVTLIYAGVEQKVHKCVLMTLPYFQALWESGMIENDKDTVTINVGSEYAIQAAVMFLYLNQTVATSLENVAELLEIADYLQISAMKDECCDFLSRLKVGPENYFTLCVLGDKYELEDVYQKGHEYLIAHLLEVLENKQILNLYVKSVSDIIKDDTLCYVPAEKLFSFLIRWVEYDVESRLIHFPELFCNLKLERFTEEVYNKEVSCHIWITRFPSCQDHLAKFIHDLKTGTKKLNPVEKTLFLMAGNECAPLKLTVNDIDHSVSLRRLLGFLPYERRWVEFPPLPLGFGDGDAVLSGCNGVLYVAEWLSCNILNRGQRTQQLFKYNIERKEWREMNVPVGVRPNRHYESIEVVSLKSCRSRIYILTSCRCNNGMAKALVLYLLQEGDVPQLLCQKELLSNVPNPSFAKVCVVLDRYICVLVKQANEDDGNSGPVFVYYDLESGGLTHVPCSRDTTSFTMMFVKDNEVILAEPGVGYAKVYSFQSQCWRDNKDLGVAEFPRRQSLDCRAYQYDCDGGKLFVFGGSDGVREKHIKTTLCYDFDKRSWQSTASSPCRVINTRSSRIQVRTSAVRCHIDCPHCKYIGHKNKARYNIMPPADLGIMGCVYSYWSSEDEDELLVVQPGGL